MKTLTVRAFEFNDLSEELRNKIRERYLTNLVQVHLLHLTDQLKRGEITEEHYYDELGCSKEYAETTAWFVPACYYQKHKELIDAELESMVSHTLFNRDGERINIYPERG